jgi:hypothetical protein
MDFAWRLCLARPPDDFERNRMLRLLQDHRRWYAEHPEDAAALTAEPSCDAASELAAWIATANVLLNLDEMITRE